MKRLILRMGGLLALVSVSIFYGMAAHEFQLPPYTLVKASYSMLLEMTSTANEEQLKTSKAYLETDVAALVSIEQAQHIAQLRDRLIDFIWGEPELPETLPLVVAEGFSDDRYRDISSLVRIDKLIIAMDFALESRVYHFVPESPSETLVLYHQGHEGDFYHGKHVIKRFLDSGYSVLAFSMPLLGLNNQPKLQLPRLGILQLTGHDQMKFLSPDKGHPVKYFIEPVVVALNYIEKHYSYTHVSMVGISGGGWTTTMAAAVDTRIGSSFPVAGSYPIFLRSNSEKEWGDYEQTAPDLYRTANYLELYLLGAYGEGRRQLQVINQYDSCCFAGVKWDTYKNILEQRVRQLGAGSFDLLLDSSHKKHLISGYAMQIILDELENIDSRDST